MKENENWKDYLFPSCLAAGLLALTISAAVFGRQGFERGDGRLSVVTEDDSAVFFISEDVSFDRVIMPVKAADLVKKPENMDDPLVFDKWNDSQFRISFSNRLSRTRIDDVPKLLEEVSEIRESDGAIYYYALGYIYDQLMRRASPLDSRGKLYALAAEYYDKAIELDDGNAVFYHFRGQADYQYAQMTGISEYYKTAIPFYVEAERLAPHWVMPISLQGWCTFYLHQYPQSLALFERAEKIDPDCWDVKTGLPQVREKMTQTGIVREQVKKPENMDDPLAFDKWNDDQLLSAVSARLRNAQVEDVPHLLEDISEIRESDGAIYYYALGYIFDQLMRLSSPGDTRERLHHLAVDNFDKAIELNGENAVLYHFRGLTDFIYSDLTKQQETLSTAIPHFVKAEQLAPEWVMPVAMQGWCAFNMGKFREALFLFDRAADLDSGYGQVNENLIQVRANLRQKSEFFDENAPLDFTGDMKTLRIKKPETTDSRELDRWNDVFREIVVSAGPQNPEDVPELVTRWTGLTKDDGKFYHYVCGYVHDRNSRLWKEFRLSHYTQAVKHFTKAIELDPEVAVFYHFRGQVKLFFAKNENAPDYYEKAIDDYDRAERCDPAWAMPADLHGWALIHLERYDEALVCLERAVAIDSDCFDAMSGIVQVIDKKTEIDPTNIDLMKQGLDWIERWHHIIIQRNDDQQLPNGTELAKKLIARWQTQEKISAKDYPKCYTRDQYEKMIVSPTHSEGDYERYVLIYEILMRGEVSPYFYNEFKNPSRNPFSSPGDETRINFEYAYVLFKQGNYEKAIAASEHFQKIADSRVSTNHSAEIPNIHHIHIKSLFRLERYDDVIDYYTSGRVTLD
ncbi:MAG: hypothetical protein FWD31_13145, partial [Planctomycetaceae bacterium]|nr:hypothetical protein [Planctomycetaceae bacterium]